MKKTLLILIIFALSISAGYIYSIKANQNDTSAGQDKQNGNNEVSGTSSEISVLDLTGQDEIIMEIKNSSYEKPNIKIKKGTTVTWTNRDIIKHNVMREHEESAHAHDAPSKDEVNPNKFASPLLGKDESYGFMFNETGTFEYHCAPHPFMRGIIYVTD